MPNGVSQAIIGVWVTIGLSVVAALISRWTDVISTGMFVLYIFVYALFCIFPYKLGKGSNPTRWVYSILIAVSMLFMLGGMAGEMPISDLVLSILMIPIEIFVLVRLFQSEATQWFLQKN